MYPHILAPPLVCPTIDLTAVSSCAAVPSQPCFVSAPYVSDSPIRNSVIRCRLLQGRQAPLGILATPCRVVQGRQALAISLNKLGDILYLQGDVRGAREQYCQGLAVRRRVLEQIEADGASNGAEQPPNGHAEAGQGAAAASRASVQLDVATSLGKLADAEQVGAPLLEPAVLEHAVQRL